VSSWDGRDKKDKLGEDLVLIQQSVLRLRKLGTTPAVPAARALCRSVPTVKEQFSLLPLWREIIHAERTLTTVVVTATARPRSPEKSKKKNRTPSNEGVAKYDIDVLVGFFFGIFKITTEKV